MERFALALLLLGAAPPAAAQTAAAKPAAPAPTSAQVDPERLALARTTVDFIWPLGTYQRMMGGAMDQMMDSMLGGMFDVKIGDMVPQDKEMTEEDKKAAATTMREAIAKKDPYFEERMRITNKVMMTEMGVVFSKVEPAVREGLATAYAKKFNAQQLTDLNGFFKTPTGRFYAAESIMLFMDPEMMKAMMGMMPDLMKAMPAIMEKVKKATAHLPEPPKEEEGEKAEDAVDSAA